MDYKKVKQMAPKISVIVPVYNVEKFLSRCLDSIINQTLKEIEIICVDDGSTDNSPKILKKYAERDKRIIIFTQENAGLSGARNSGMKIATGKYIAFVDSDDWVGVNFYKKLYSSAEKYKADVACASILRKYKSGRERKKLIMSEEKIFSTANEKFRVTNTPRMSYVWNKIYNRKALLKLDLQFKNGVYFEDMGFTIRALYYLKTVVTVPGTAYYYYVNEESISREMTDKKQQDLLAARADFIKFSKEHYITCDERWYIKSKTVYKFLGIPLLKVYEWETIKKYYLFSMIPIAEKRISL